MEKLTTENLLWLGLAVAIGVPVLLGVWKRVLKSMKDSESTERAEREKEEQTRLQQLVRAGTHDSHGYRLCITCSDKTTRATQPPYVVEQREGLWDLIKRSFGAPSRYVIRQSKMGIPVYCDQCAPLVYLEHQDYVLRYEKKLREQRRDAALELRRWLKSGVNEVVSQRIEEHDEEIKKTMPEEKKAPVVQLRSDLSGN